MKKSILLLILLTCSYLHGFIFKNSTSNPIALFYLRDGVQNPRAFRIGYRCSNEPEAAYIIIEAETEVELKIDKEAESIWFYDTKNIFRPSNAPPKSLFNTGLSLMYRNLNREMARTGAYNTLNKDSGIVELYYEDNPEWKKGESEKDKKRLTSKVYKKPKY